MIILSAFLFYHIIHLTIYDAEIRFTFCFRFQYVKDRSDMSPEVETRGLGPQCRAGSRLSFLYIYIFTETRELQHLRKHDFANLAVPLTRVVLNLQYSDSLRSPFLSSSERRCSWYTLNTLSAVSSERRCSSRTFRYGYLVTT